MKINNKQESLAVTASLFAGTIVLSAIVATASAIYTNKANMDEKIADHKILISKIETLKKVNSMYEASYKTGFENCIKLNPENACAKRFNQITNHFSNEYNTKLLKLLAEQSGIKLSEDIKSGRLTAVTNTPEHDDEISGLVKYYSNVVSNDKQKIIEHKDEKVSIGSKFAALGLKAQNEQFREFDTQDLLKSIELEEARNSGGSDSTVGKEKSWVEKTAE